MPSITFTIPVEAIPAIMETFGGETAAETVANVKAFLMRRLVEEVRASRQYKAAEAAKATVADIVVT